MDCFAYINTACSILITIGVWAGFYLACCDKKKKSK